MIDVFLCGDGTPTACLTLEDCEVVTYLNEAGILETLVVGDYGYLSVEELLMDETTDGEEVPVVVCYDCANSTTIEHMNVPVSFCKVVMAAEDGEPIDEGDLRSAESTWENQEGPCRAFCMITSRDAFDM